MLFFFFLKFFSFWEVGTTPEIRALIRSGAARVRAARSGALVQTPGGFAGTVFRGLQPSEARLRRAKRGRPAERSEAARSSSGGRHYKKTQKGSTRKPRGTTYFFFLLGV